MVKKEEKPTLRSRVAEKFSRHEDEPETEPTPKQTRVGVPLPGDPEFPMAVPAPEPTYSVGAGAPPAEQKKLHATIESDRKALKKKQS